MAKSKKTRKMKVLTFKKEKDFFSLIDKRLRRQGYELLEMFHEFKKDSTFFKT